MAKNINNDNVEGFARTNLPDSFIHAKGDYFSTEGKVPPYPTDTDPIHGNQILSRHHPIRRLKTGDLFAIKSHFSDWYGLMEVKEPVHEAFGGEFISYREHYLGNDTEDNDSTSELGFVRLDTFIKIDQQHYPFDYTYNPRGKNRSMGASIRF